MNEELEAVLDEYVRPLLRTHGGDMEVISVEDGLMRFRLKGKCAGCPAADLTTEELIQSEVLDRSGPGHPQNAPWRVNLLSASATAAAAIRAMTGWRWSSG